MTDDKPHPSRRAWANTVAPEPEYAPVGHTHEQRRTALVPLYVGMTILTIAVVFLLVYILGRGAARDAQIEQTNELIRAGICDLLDQLPPSPLLDVPRGKYGCGPGTPIDQLPPDVREQLGQARPQVQQATPAPTGTPPPLGGPAVVDDYDPQPEPPTPRPGMAPVAEPTRPPLVDLEPITDPVCDALGVCL